MSGTQSAHQSDDEQEMNLSLESCARQYQKFRYPKPRLQVQIPPPPPSLRRLIRLSRRHYVPLAATISLAFYGELATPFSHPGQPTRQSPLCVQIHNSAQNSLDSQSEPPRTSAQQIAPLGISLNSD